ncbi:MAG: hypothetical protein U1C12_02385, partial [Patescibacteria group bacterium]|nr:hypothetical protein [Patescibacteria group bacterium]
LATYLTGLAGLVLNYVVQFTVVEMADNLKNIGTIDTAWKTIRDIGNMGFIFILLYAAIRTILGIGSDTKKLIVNIVVVAILINFSLFFTKIVIDASNVLAITFYDAIAPSSLSTTWDTGLSGTLMKPLKIESLWANPKIEELVGKDLIIIGVMGTIVSLIAAFVFFAVAIMFVIRFVVLIFVLILSPLAFLGFILPQLKEYKDQWQEALLGQAFFAPIYFMLTWIVIKISSGLLTSTSTAMQGGSMATVFLGAVGADGNVLKTPSSSIALLVNFIVMIAFLIASLVIAKKWADKAGHGVPGLTKWATGFAGGATLGMAGRFGRGTVGRAGVALGDSEALKERAAKGGVGGMAARLTLATGRKTGGASFDVRGTPLTGTLGAGQAQKGGFAEFKKKQAEAEVKFAASLAPSAKAIAKDKTLLGNKAEIDEEVKNIEKAKKRSVDEIRNSEELKSAEVRERSASDIVSKLEVEARAAGDNLEEAKIEALETAKVKLEEVKKEAGEARKRVREQAENMAETYEAQKEALKTTEVKPASEIRKERFAKAVEKSAWAKFRGYNYDAAAQIRKGKSAKDKAVDILKDLQKEGVIAAEEKPETPPETQPTPPAGSTPPPTT